MAEFVTQPYYSAAELAAMALHTIKLTARSIRTRAIEEGWESRRRAGRGGGNEYALSSLPAEVQAEIRERHLQALAKQNPVVVREVKHLDRDLGALSDKQRAVADARMALARYVREVEAVCKTRQEAVRRVSELSRAGELPGDLNRQCAIACARKGGQAGRGDTRPLPVAAGRGAVRQRRRAATRSRPAKAGAAAHHPDTARMAAGVFGRVPQHQRRLYRRGLPQLCKGLRGTTWRGAAAQPRRGGNGNEPNARLYPRAGADYRGADARS